MKTKPPKAAERLLLWFLRSDLAEEVQGDLEEKFYATARNGSTLRAKLNYWYQVINYLRSFAIRKKRSRSHFNQYDMLQNYFRIGIRNLIKSKFFSLINIAGMAISMAIFFIIALYVQDELRYDKQLENADLKYRIFAEHFSHDGSRKKLSMVPPMIAPTLAADFPQVEYYARFLNFIETPLFEVGSSKYTEDKGGAADPAIFKIFSLELLEGDVHSALSQPNTIAINSTLKQKYFGDDEALGKTIEIFNQNFEVVAVFRDFSPYSHFQRNYFLALEGLIPERRMQSWEWSQMHTYVKVKPAADIEALESGLQALAEKYAWPLTKPGGGYYIPHLMPLQKIHLYAHDQLWDFAVRGNVQTLYILAAIGIFILIIAMLNFVNLSTARAINRFKEVGVRKVMGAFRSQLIQQFVSESVIIAFMALLIAAFLTELVLPYLNSFTEKNIPTGVMLSPGVVVSLLVFGLLIGTCAGMYPAFYISANKPTSILSNKDTGRSGKSMLRQGLVVFQLIISFFLIMASFVVSEQHTYMRTADMGFEKENIIVLPLRGDMGKHPESTKQSFSDHGDIVSVTLGYGLPGEAFAGDGITDLETGKDWSTSMLTVDHDYVKTLGLEVVAGRDFSKDIAADERHAFILSEAAARMLGYNNVEDALGHKIGWDRWDAPDSLKAGHVIGIVKNIQLNSMRESITPVVLHVFPYAYKTIALRVSPRDLPATLAHLEMTWKKFNTEWPFEYRFLDDNFDRMYKAEERLSLLFKIFTGFTIFVACLGLFGLVVYNTTQRYREVSIRKVLGATEGNLFILLAKNYLVLIVIAFTIAVPLSYFAAGEWLQNFSFRVQITPLLFIKAGFLIVAIALLTVGVQSFKATRANPVEALKEQ